MSHKVEVNILQKANTCLSDEFAKTIVITILQNIYPCRLSRTCRQLQQGLNLPWSACHMVSDQTTKFQAKKMLIRQKMTRFLQMKPLLCRQVGEFMQNAVFSSSVTGRKKPVREIERECDHDAVFGAANFF